jgi:hypothetical protein
VPNAKNCTRRSDAENHVVCLIVARASHNVSSGADALGYVPQRISKPDVSTDRMSTCSKGRLWKALNRSLCG